MRIVEPLFAVRVRCRSRRRQAFVAVRVRCRSQRRPGAFVAVRINSLVKSR